MMEKIWKAIPPGMAHKLAPLGIHWWANKINSQSSDDHWKSFQWKNLHFRNPLGIAGGVDKNAMNIHDWKRLGCGFVEFGTVTPRPQKPNSGKILDRDWESQNLWNKMGFPNHGAEELYYNLLHQKKSLGLPVFVNIGKNRNTSNEEAHLDYKFCTYKLNSVADAFVINISSPNTQGLRDLQTKDFITKIISEVQEVSTETPVLVKLSPDMSEADFDTLIETLVHLKIDGFVLTNTTTSRPKNCPFPAEGGLSGKGLSILSADWLKRLINQLGEDRDNYLIVSAGGILTAQDVFTRLEIGAHLVQVYSALVFHGPSFFRDVALKSKRALL